MFPFTDFKRELEMPSISKFLSTAALAFILPINLTACQPKVEPIKPTAEQQASLNRLHKNCIAASRGKQGKMMNLARLRKKQQTFTCDELKLNCETDYASEMCQGPMIIAKVEWAHEKLCRKSRQAASSQPCRKLMPCNAKGFESPECADVIAWHNR